jgi:hypothetical protein
MNIATDGYGLDTTYRTNIPTNGYGESYRLVPVARLIDRYTFGPRPMDTLTGPRRPSPRAFGPMRRR